MGSGGSGAGGAGGGGFGGYGGGSTNTGGTGYGGDLGGTGLAGEQSGGAGGSGLAGFGGGGIAGMSGSGWGGSMGSAGSNPGGIAGNANAAAEAAARGYTGTGAINAFAGGYAPGNYSVTQFGDGKYGLTSPNQNWGKTKGTFSMGIPTSTQPLGALPPKNYQNYNTMPRPTDIHTPTFGYGPARGIPGVGPLGPSQGPTAPGQPGRPNSAPGPSNNPGRNRGNFGRGGYQG